MIFSFAGDPVPLHGMALPQVWTTLARLFCQHWDSCHSNPFSNALLEFRRRVRQVMNMHPETQDGPVIVHCKWDSYICDNCDISFHLIAFPMWQCDHPCHSPSDGAGRSGVYIVIDSNIELCEEDGVFDVFGYLKKIRGLRRGLVETQVR